MKKWFLELLLSDKYSNFILSCIFGGIFIGYFGIYSLMGNKVILKSQGMVYLSEKSAITNIIIEVIIILFIYFKDQYKKN